MEIETESQDQCQSQISSYTDKLADCKNVYFLTAAISSTLLLLVTLALVSLLLIRKRMKCFEIKFLAFVFLYFFLGTVYYVMVTLLKYDFS